MTVRLFELDGMGEGEIIDLVFGGDLFADTSAAAEHIDNCRRAWAATGYPL